MVSIAIIVASYCSFSAAIYFMRLPLDVELFKILGTFT